MSSTKILMVCLGNICRSVLAEGILKKHLEDLSLSDRIEVDSAGVAAYHIGSSPDKRSVDVAKKYGIDIGGLKARKIEESDLDKFDYIFVMDQYNYQDVMALSKTESQKKKIHYLLDALQFSDHRSVPDPYYGNQSDFENVFHLINGACAYISKFLKDNQKKK